MRIRDRALCWRYGCKGAHTECLSLSCSLLSSHCPTVKGEVAARLHSIAETLCAGSIISYVKIYFCNVKPAGAAAVFFYQVRIRKYVTLSTAKALTL